MTLRVGDRHGILRFPETGAGSDPGLVALYPRALAAAAPRADAAAWAAALEPTMTAAGINTKRRVAALFGQIAAEAGPGLTGLSENTNYTKAARLCAIFPRAFPSLDVAARYAGKPQPIANRAYANRLGNGDEASGDGWRFRGAGLIQLTGRENFANFAKSMGLPAEDAERIADWVRTPPGACASACWYWNRRKLNALADQWQLNAITFAVNGPAMLAKELRASSSEAALRAFG
jgi:predicted chitinase